MPYNQKDFKESNVNYLNKDFDKLKGSLISYAKSYFPNSYRDFNETSPGMMLMEMSAYVGDVMSFYIDQQYREMLLPLAEERRNLINMAKMFGYKVKPIVPAHVNLTFTAEVNAQSADASKVDYTDGAVWDSGIQVSSVANSDLIFETLEPIDFTITASADTNVVRTTNADSGLATSYTLSRTVKAVSAETKTKTFTISAPSKFLKLTIPDTNVVDIISCIDSNGNNWYEVDYLAQDKVPISTHYTSDDRDSAYYDLQGEAIVSDVPVPYSLQYIVTSKRFTRETNEDNTTSLVFGNGILKNGTTLDGNFLDLEQLGIVVPGQTGDLNEAIDPLLGNEYSSLGETPIQTTLTVTYRVGGGINANAAVADLTEFDATTIPLVQNSGVDATLDTVTNNLPAIGGKNGEDIEEIREKTKAFFTTQNRCVTKEDYEARTLNVPSKYGNIAKVYVSRTTEGDITSTANFIGKVQSVQSQISDWTTFISTYLNAVAGSDGTIDSTQITTIQGYLDDIDTQIGTIPTDQQILTSGAGTIKIYILSYDRNKNLVGNPAANTPSAIGNETDFIPTILKNNIASYIDNFRILTDSFQVIDGFIINFGIIFDVVAHKYANKKEVKLLCIQKIKDYFKIQKMQFSQPIYISQLEYDLMSVDGVRAVNYVTMTQHDDWNGEVDLLPDPTFTYSVTGDTQFDDGADITDSGGTPGYGWNYDFEAAYENGVILPPHPDTPGVFELKNPNTNIRGVVR
jgi:hypothetical protein